MPSFYFADVKQILYFKAFHFSRSNWGSSCIFLYTSMTKKAAQPTCCLWKSQWRTFPSRLPKWSNNRTKQVSVASGAIKRYIFIAGPHSPVKRKSRARASLARPSINPISSFLPFLYLKERKCSKANLLKGSVSGYLATGNIYLTVTMRNTYGQSHSPSDVSNLSICQQLKACFKRSIVKTCILQCICRPCFNLSCLSKKRNVTFDFMLIPYNVFQLSLSLL